MIHLHSSTAKQRAQWVSILVAQEGTYGVVSQLGKEAKVSRQTLYSWKAKGQSALQAAFEAKEPHATSQLERAVLTLLVEGHASYRGIQACLADLLGHQVSLGTITAIVQEAGARAQRWLEQQVAEQGRVMALDEQYSSKRGEAYLNIVDVHSTQVWATLPAVAVDGESWTLALWYLHEQGVVSRGTVSDGGRAIAEALRITQALSTHQRDVWHVLYLAAQVQARLQRVVQEEEERGRLIMRQEQHRASTGKQAVGRPRQDDGEPARATPAPAAPSAGGSRVSVCSTPSAARGRGALSGEPTSSAQRGSTAWRSGDGAGFARGSRAVGSGSGAPRGATGQQAGAARFACPALLCRRDGRLSARSPGPVRRASRRTHRLGLATSGEFWESSPSTCLRPWTRHGVSRRLVCSRSGA